MKLARLDRSVPGEQPIWGFVEDGFVYPAPASAPSLVDALAAGSETLAALRDRATPAISLADIRLLPPIAAPGQVICVGLNYHLHARESGLDAPTEPLLFSKFPACVVGAHDPIVLPPQSTQVDWEAELALVVGNPITRPVDEEGALTCVAGFLVANDVSARDLQRTDGQWSRAKSFRSFCPIGPWLTTRDEVGDGSGLRITLTVNGLIKQDSNTSDMIASAARIVSYVSAITNLSPGDLVLTGTPAGTGIGHTPPESLHPGDTVEVTIDGLGTLTNPVVGAEELG